MTAEQIDEVLRTAQAGDKTAIAEALRSIADLSVSLLRMIDARREGGIAFDSSYNEQELRRALASMASQTFPPGPPMVPATTSVFAEVHDFQRFECVTLNRTGGRTSRELKIVCRCGWSSISIDRDPDADIAIAAARDLLQAHVSDTIERAHTRTGKADL